MPWMCRSGSSTTAAATTGPARQPRPTSSQPATYTNPAPDLRRARHLDLGDRRRVQREDALDPLAERDLAHREGGARAAAVNADDDALENLDAFLVALAHFHMHADGVARPHRRPLRQLLFFDQLNRAHRHPPQREPRRSAAPAG